MLWFPALSENRALFHRFCSCSLNKAHHRLDWARSDWFPLDSLYAVVLFLPWMLLYQEGMSVVTVRGAQIHVYVPLLFVGHFML